MSKMGPRERGSWVHELQWWTHSDHQWVSCFWREFTSGWSMVGEIENSPPVKSGRHNGRITMGGCLFFSRWKSSAQPKKLEQEHSHHIEKRPLFNLFMNFYWVLRNTFKTQNGDQTICHCFLNKFISDIITVLQKFEFSPAGSTGFLHFCSSFFVTAAPSWPCGKKRKPFDLTEGCSHSEKWEFSWPQKWMRQRGFSAWGIQTGPFAAP